MPSFKISRASQKGKTWQAKGINPNTGREMTISGGQKGVKVGPKNRSKGTVKSFMARHGEPKTAKQYVNAKLWKGTKKIGDTVNIPPSLF